MTPEKNRVQRKLNDSLDGGDIPSNKELAENFSKEELADKLRKYVIKVLNLRESNERLKKLNKELMIENTRF